MVGTDNPPLGELKILRLNHLWCNSCICYFTFFCVCCPADHGFAGRDRGHGGRWTGFCLPPGGASGYSEGILRVFSGYSLGGFRVPTGCLPDGLRVFSGYSEGGFQPFRISGFQPFSLSAFPQLPHDVHRTSSNLRSDPAHSGVSRPLRSLARHPVRNGRRAGVGVSNRRACGRLSNCPLPASRRVGVLPGARPLSAQIRNKSQYRKKGK